MLTVKIYRNKSLKREIVSKTRADFLYRFVGEDPGKEWVSLTGLTFDNLYRVKQTKIVRDIGRQDFRSVLPYFVLSNANPFQINLALRAFFPTPALTWGKKRATRTRILTEGRCSLDKTKILPNIFHSFMSLRECCIKGLLPVPWSKIVIISGRFPYPTLPPLIPFCVS